MFDWDSANEGHIAEHGVSREEAEQVILGNPIDLRVQLRNGEERIPHVGPTAAGRILVVVITERGELIRVVTAFPASKVLRQLYQEQSLEQDLKDLHHGKTPRDP